MSVGSVCCRYSVDSFQVCARHPDVVDTIFYVSKRLVLCCSYDNHKEIT